MMTTMIYSAKFDERSRRFRTDGHKENIKVLRMYEGFANDKVRQNGFLFLNEVLESLGLPRVKDGQYLGWLYASQPDRKCVQLNPQFNADGQTYTLNLNIHGNIIQSIDWENQ